MESLFYIFCTTLPSHILPFALFWNFEWRSRKAAMVLVGANVLCKMAAAGFFFANGLYFRNAELLFAGIGFLIYACFLRLPWSKLLFTYLLVVDYLLIVRGIASFCAVHVWQSSPQGWQSTLVCVVLYLVTLPFLIRFFRRAAVQIYRLDAPRLWRTIWLIPALLTALTLLFTNTYLEDNVESLFFFLCRISLLVCVFVIYDVLLQSLEALEQQVTLREQVLLEKHLMDVQREEQKKQSLLLMEKAEQTRRQQHDLRHQLKVLQSLAGTDNPKLNQYLNTLLEQVPESIRTYCENPAVNALVSHYAAVCEREKIACACSLMVPAQQDQAMDIALCGIVGNLLENAVEACLRMTEGNRFLRLNSSLRSGVLTITMDNSFSGTVREENGKFYSSKRDGFGVGLSSVQATARDYGGNARFEAEGTVFHSSVYLHLAADVSRTD